MKTLVAKIVGKGRIELIEEEIKLLPHQVLIRHLCAAPSIGTYLHIYKGEHRAIKRGWNPEYPVPIWGSGVGKVIEIGEDVKGVNVGELVTIKELQQLSVKEPAQLISLPEGLDIEAASFLFQARVALQGVRRAGIFLGDTVLVMGQGAIGIFAAQFAKLAGARKVITTDIFDSHLKISRDIGVDFTINVSTEDVAEKVNGITKGKGADVVIDVSGSAQAFNSGAIACRHLGKLVIIGWFVEPFQINLGDDFTEKGLEMVVCHSADYFGDWKQYRKSGSSTPLIELKKETDLYMLELMKEGKLKSKELITHRFEFENMQKVYELADKKQKECLGIVVGINKD